MPSHLYAETLLAPGLGITFQWRLLDGGQDLLALIDRESPVYGALVQAIERFEHTVFELAPNKPTLIEWANSQHELEDPADLRELRLGAAHVFRREFGLHWQYEQQLDPLTPSTDFGRSVAVAATFSH